MAPSQLQIKINALSRLMKEESLYRREVEDQAKRIEQHKANNGDEYELKKMVEVLKDTEQMIPDLRTKVQTTLEGLKKTLEKELDEDTSAAQAKVEEAEKFLQ
ncbi:tubulin-specific chaperone A [Trichomonascus vanleenenianus]|uniref:Rbl2p n=1 Tax=Trichomonascus vanleenenianus TaxID=2268995 RepID=UPI003EC98DE6